jgi:hypothetical protein
MMGAFMDQIVNNYLSKKQIRRRNKQVNNTNKIVENGKNRQWSTPGMRLMAISTA